MSWFNLNAKVKRNTASRRVYLDHAAATPLRPEVRKVIDQAWSISANPSAIHKEGIEARNTIESSRLRLARCLKIRPEGVVFTGNGTESNNLAIYGLLRQLKEDGREFSDMSVISTKLEHPSVEEVLKHLTSYGVQVHYCDIDEEGKIDQNHFESLLSKTTVLVTFAYVNSEIGVIQDVSRLSRVVKRFNQAKGLSVKIHVDAAQAPLWLPCQLDVLGIDMMSLDAGKCYGPKGVGVLAFRHGVSLKGVLLGGGQERGLRAGTENTPLILGAVEAMLLAQNDWESRSNAVRALQESFVVDLLKIKGVVLNGSKESRVANNVNISVEGVDGEFAVVSMDEAGFAISTKSACSGAGGGGSKVIKTIYGDDARASTTLRITLGETTTKSELNKFVKALKKHVEKVRIAQAKINQV